MATQRSSKRKKLKAKADNEPTIAAEKAKIGTKSAHIQIKEKKRAIPKSRESLTKAQKASQAAPRKVKQGHQARIKRVSFIVRLTVDEYNQPGRTEIEHVPSGRKQNFPSLEAARLVTFMKACIGPERISEDVIPITKTQEELITSTSAPAEPRASLIISDVQVFCRGIPDFTTLMLTPEEPFILQAHFQLQVPNAQELTLPESSFETKIYASEISNGNSQLLKIYSAKLIQGMSKYTVPMELGGLPTGLYRLFTVVTLHRPIKLVGFYGKTFIHVG
jgi:hypothetical protein